MSNRAGWYGGFGYGAYSRPRSDFEWARLYGDNARLRNPVHTIAVDVSQVKKRFHTATEDDEGREVLTPAYNTKFERLLRCPHPRLPWSKWSYILTVFLRLLGSCPVVIEEWDEDGDPARLTPLPPHFVMGGPYNGKDYWDVQWWTESRQIPVSDVVYFYCPDTLDPMSPLGMARALSDEVNIDEAMQKFSNYYFRNMAFLGAVVNAPGCEPSELKKEWEREREGILNAFKTLFVNSEGMTVTNLSPQMRDLAFPQGLRLNRDLMGQGFQVPPERQGIIEASNRSTIDAADFFQMKGNVAPDVTYIEEVLNLYVGPLFGFEGDPLTVVRFDHPVKETVQVRQAQATAGVQGGWMTINEARKLNDLDPLPGGDVLLLPTNNVTPVSAFGTIALPALAQPAGGTDNKVFVQVDPAQLKALIGG